MIVFSTFHSLVLFLRICVQAVEIFVLSVHFLSDLEIDFIIQLYLRFIAGSAVKTSAAHTIGRIKVAFANSPSG